MVEHYRDHIDSLPLPFADLVDEPLDESTCAEIDRLSQSEQENRNKLLKLSNITGKSGEV